MTRDNDILGALRFEPMTAAEIGRGFAPDHIKDRAAWGRKWVAKHRAMLVEKGDMWTVPAAPRPDLLATYTGPDFTRVPVAVGFLNAAQELLHSWLAGASGLLDPHRYRAPHAPRGTPPRPHAPRHTRRIRYCNV